MTSRSRLILPAALVLGAAGLSFWLFHSPKSSGPVAAASPVAQVAPRVDERPRTVATPETRVAAEAPRVANAPPVRVRRSTAVARVNGTTLTGKDVVAFRHNDPDEQEIAQDSFAFLRQRAIDRELTLQEARAQKLELTAAQQAQLVAVRARAAERGETDPAQIDFEEAEARAQLLLAALVEKSGAPPQLAGDADVDRQLKEHAAELGALPPAERAPAEQKIRLAIRQTLYEEYQQRYQQRLRDYLDGLRTHGRVTD